MLQVRNITHWLGDVKILDQVSFTLNRNQRAGLIGSNGSGKTTLLKIISGEMEPDQGSVQLSLATLRLGYLPQALEFAQGQVWLLPSRPTHQLPPDGETRLAAHLP